MVWLKGFYSGTFLNLKAPSLLNWGNAANLHRRNLVGSVQVLVCVTESYVD